MLDYVQAVTCGKPMAIAYVDDRAVEFRGNFADSYRGVLELAEVKSGQIRRKKNVCDHEYHRTINGIRYGYISGDRGPDIKETCSAWA
jgi:hypothetical protein